MSSAAAALPADTRMMGIVHSALRRDLCRLRIVLALPEVAETRRRPIAEHVLWLMTFLHNHHLAEDEGLYPTILRRNADARDVLAVMEADHHRIEPTIVALNRAADDYRTGTGSAVALISALGAMADALVPHLAREEQVMMPIVAETITDAEWQAWDQEFNIKPKRMRMLADEAHWVLDGLDDDGRHFVEHLVPAVPRFLILRLLGGRYRRRRDRLWGGTSAASVDSLAIEAYESWIQRDDQNSEA